MTRAGNRIQALSDRGRAWRVAEVLGQFGDAFDAWVRDTGNGRRAQAGVGVVQAVGLAGDADWLSDRKIDRRIHQKNKLPIFMYL